MSEADFASWNGTAAYGVGDRVDPTPSHPARRSISIFSRRGTDTPDSIPSFSAVAEMARTPSKGLSESHRHWLRRRGSDSKRTRASTRKPKGTILNAVPQTRTMRLTDMEHEMATSPNEEIMSAISENSQGRHPLSPVSGQTSPSGTQSPPTPARHRPSSQSTISLVHRNGGPSRHNSYSRIGVWVDGVTHWSSGIGRPSTAPQAGKPKDETGSAIAPAEQRDRTSVGKPSLSVAIPTFESFLTEPAFSQFGQTKSSQPEVSVAPADIVSRFSAAVPQDSAATCFSKDVSPLNSADARSSPPKFRNPSVSTVDEAAEEGTTESRHHHSSSSIASSADLDADSEYSKRSSTTSLGVVEGQQADPSTLGMEPLDKTPSIAFIVPNPADAGVFDEPDSRPISANVNKPLPPIPPMKSWSMQPSSTRPITPHPRMPKNTRTSPRGKKTDGIALRNMMRGAKRSIDSLNRLDEYDAEFMRASPYPASDASSEPGSPTLSQAENELEVKLTTISEDDMGEQSMLQDKPSQASSEETTAVKQVQEEDEGAILMSKIQRSDSVRSVLQPSPQAPKLPKRSRKRDWCNGPKATYIASQVARSTSKAPRRRKSENSLLDTETQRRSRSESLSRSRRCQSTETLLSATSYAASLADVVKTGGICSAAKFAFDDGLCVVSGPKVLRMAGHTDQIVDEAATIAAFVAEDVLLNILSSLTSLDDLFSMALINKGMYRVFMENELHLMRTVAYNQSPAGWELREWCPPAPPNESNASSKESSQLEHTASTYMRCHNRDSGVIEELKSLVLGQAVMRHETAAALISSQNHESQRFTDAFWRIWTFCIIFGFRKDREDDITGQLDWLKGGLLANNHGFSATVNTNLDFDLSSVLLNAPECFASGNKDGLSAEDLYDMTELWTCISSLLSGYLGRVNQARRYGIFTKCDIEEGDIEQEEHMLEEWTYFILTLGPSVVLELAKHAADPSPIGFALARANGWTNWRLPICSSSRSTFLKEPVARLYEERISALARAAQCPFEREKKEMSRKRVTALAAEIKLRRQTSACQRLPLIDMAHERPMSTASLTPTHQAPPSRRTPPPLSAHPAFAHDHRQDHFTLPATALTHCCNPLQTHPGHPGYWSPRHISPILEERVDASKLLSLADLNGKVDTTPERAVRRITDMGFSAEQARHALWTTDMGDGLRVDRAVELLLRAG